MHTRALSHGVRCCGVIRTNARKDSVQGGHDVETPPLILTEKHIYFTCCTVKSVGS